MLRWACMGLLTSCALFGTPALAREDVNAWTLGGGFDLLELRAGKSDEVFFWDATFSISCRSPTIFISNRGSRLAGRRKE